MTRAARKILIVDDDYSFAKYARALMEERGHAAMILLDARKCVDVARAEKPDLVLMDLMMPDVSGAEAIRALKADSITRAIPIILCSMSEDRADIDAAMAGGAAAFLPKPLRPDDLFALLQKTLGEATA